MPEPVKCRHVMPSGRNCHAPALHGKAYCSAHWRRRILAEANVCRRHSVVLPPLEDADAIRMSIDEILAALSAHKITRREASTYLYGVQLATQLLNRLGLLQQPPDTADKEEEEVATNHASPANDTAPAASTDSASTAASAVAEYPAETPLPLTRKQYQERRRFLEESLQNYRETQAYYKTLPPDSPNDCPGIVLADMKRNIAQVEDQIRTLDEEHAPDVL